MRWQDEKPINDLVDEGVQISDSYLTIARMGEDRKESQIGSQPIADARRAREWLDRHAEAAAVATGCARFRIRLWRANRTTVRSVQTRGWVEPDVLTIGAPPVFVPNAARSEPKPAEAWGDPLPDDPTPGPDPYYHLDAPSPSASRPATPDAAAQRATDLARPPRPAADRAPSETRPPSRLAAIAGARSETAGTLAANRHPQRADGFQPLPVQRQAPQPVYAPAPHVPCPTRASTAATAAALNSRLAERSGEVAGLKQSLRDKENAAARSQQLADQRRARITELEAQGTQAAKLITSLRREVKDLNASAAELLAELNAFTE